MAKKRELKLHSDLMRGHLKWSEQYDDPALFHFRMAHDHTADVAQRLLDAREKALANVMQTRAANLRQYAQTREKATTSALKAIQASLDRGRAEVEQARAQLNAPIAEPKNAQTAGEIRQYLRGLSREERTSLLAKAMEAGDQETVAAAMTAPGYLSGLADHEVDHYRTVYQRARDPDGWERLARLEKAQEVAERAGQRLVDFTTEIHHADNAELGDAVASEQRAREALEGL